MHLSSRIFLTTLAGVGLGVISFLHFPVAQAATLPYDPNYIIRDDIFTDKNTMSAGDIQSFLSSKGSCLATTSPDTLGSDQTAAQLIASAANSASSGKGINPRVILTTLQKEWSLITLSCAQLDSIYGGYSGGPQVYLKRALGYNVPDVLGVGTCLYSFYNQLFGASCNGDSYVGSPGSMRNAFENNRVGPAGNYPYPQAFTVQQYSDRPGDVTITPRSKSTSVLFRYTPYAYYGNYNFFTIFQGFFGPPVCSTNLNVVKGDGPQSAVLFNGNKYPITSLDALNAWGLDCIPVTYVSQGAYDSYPTAGMITRVFKEIEGPRVFIADGGLRRHIRSSLYVNDYALSNEPVYDLPQALLESLPQGSPLGFLVRASGGADIYIAQKNGKYYIPDVPTIEAWGFPLSELIDVNPTYVSALPTLGNLSTLVKGSGPDMYIASLRTFYYIPSLARIRDWNMQNSAVTILDDSFLNSLPKGGVFSRVTRGTGPDTYYIEGNKRYYLATGKVSASLQQQYGALTPMADSSISAIPFAGTKR